MNDNILKLNIFTDFDGTISKLDLGDEIFKNFGQIEPFLTDLKEGRITIKKYWMEVCKTLNENVSKEDINNFALNAEIDANFLNFVTYCNDNNWKVSIVSDGFEEYIKPILDLNNLSYLQLSCNRLEKIDKYFTPIFANASESCNCLSASCKRNIILNAIIEEEITVYIGDGYSDFCASTHCDIIFAKKNLAKYLSENKIPYHPYKNFFDVKRILKSIIASKKIKKRHQAHLLREKAFIYE